MEVQLVQHGWMLKIWNKRCDDFCVTSTPSGTCSRIPRAQQMVLQPHRVQSDLRRSVDAIRVLQRSFRKVFIAADNSNCVKISSIFIMHIYMRHHATVLGPFPCFLQGLDCVVLSASSFQRRLGHQQAHHPHVARHRSLPLKQWKFGTDGIGKGVGHNAREHLDKNSTWKSWYNLTPFS